jgi:hypothetical protein
MNDTLFEYKEQQREPGTKPRLEELQVLALTELLVVVSHMQVAANSNGLCTELLQFVACS